MHEAIVVMASFGQEQNVIMMIVSRIGSVYFGFLPAVDSFL
ncbi:hypothetical protein ACFOEK_13345 [Litoribrevibacter euphylliae]|uniref:Uncharacterized protein n=1 Tax=Litoribrevibacter euphylliae TaxID=1834034 RepID=A0ABV7HKH5_9GAMM